MRSFVIHIVLLFIAIIGLSAQVNDAKFENRINELLNFSVPTISVTDLSQMLSDSSTQIILLDTREKEEYDISHINGAIHIGYEDFDHGLLPEIHRDQKVVVYCSVGYRSEKIGEKLENKGFNQVFNLYGSIFEWVNQGGELVDNNGKPTNKIHTYNYNWSKWVTNESFEKVY